MQVKLSGLLQEAAERESQDQITVEKIQTGEMVIEALQVGERAPTVGDLRGCM